MPWTPTDAAGTESIDSLLVRFQDNTRKQIGADDSRALISTFGSITTQLHDLIEAKTVTSTTLLGDVQPWDTTTAYTTEDLAFHRGVIFMAIQDVAASDDEPIDGADWKALNYKAQYLELIALANRVTALEAGP